jgi:uncharacterized protein YegP (UPF0339 family)
MNNPKFQILKSTTNQQFYYRLKAKNGETILSGEGYTSKDSCSKGIASVKENAPIDTRYERKDSTSNYTFNLKAANGEIIGRSENYTSSQARENGISAVKQEATGAAVEDLS